VYDNHERIRIILTLQGSVLYRVIPLGVLVAAVSSGINMYYIRAQGEASWWRPKINRPWAADMIGTAISFAIVYRTSIAWSRYWEAEQQSHYMFSKWADSFTQLISFINTADRSIQKDPDWKTKPDIVQRQEKLSALRYSLAHNFSLLSALAVHRLTHGDMARMRRRSDKFGIKSSWLRFLFRVCAHWNQLIVNSQDLRFNDYTGAFEMPRFRAFTLKQTCMEARAKLQKQMKESQIGSIAGILQSFPSQSIGVDRWSPVGVRSSDGTVFEQVDEVEPAAEQGAHTAFCSDTLISCASNVTWSSDLAILGQLTREENEILDGQNENSDNTKSAPDRMILVSVWINEDINALVPNCGTPPPIMSRCYQELSNGMLGFNQTLKLADIPFPFPFSQLLELLLIIFTMILPFYTGIFTKGTIITPILAFFITIGFWGLSEISRELEDPFSDGPNQLPIIDMHERFVELLRQIYHTRKPSGAKSWEKPDTASINPTGVDGGKVVQMENFQSEVLDERVSVTSMPAIDTTAERRRSERMVRTAGSTQCSL